MPIKNAGQVISKEDNKRLVPDRPLISIIIVKAIPARINTIPPAISYFQEIIVTINRISAGILCRNNPIAISLALKPGSKTSKEKTIRKRTNNIDNILGSQVRKECGFFILKLYHKCF